MTNEICQRCGEAGEDRRTLWMACSYEMKELGLPFEERTVLQPVDGDTREAKLEIVKPAVTLPLSNGVTFTMSGPTVRTDAELSLHGLYTLRVCKECRGDWLAAIKTWFHAGKKARTSPGTGIFVRENGVNVEVSEEEWQRRAAAAGQPGREPVRVKRE